MTLCGRNVKPLFAFSVIMGLSALHLVAYTTLIQIALILVRERAAALASPSYTGFFIFSDVMGRNGTATFPTTSEQ